MMKGRGVVWVVAIAAVLALPAARVHGDPVQTGHFWAVMGGDEDNWNEFVEGGGDGFVWVGPTGTGVQSMQPAPVWKWYDWNRADTQSDAYGYQIPQISKPGWVNQWWYDHPYDPTRWKRIGLDFWYQALVAGIPGSLDLTINWSTPEWSELGLTTPPDRNDSGDPDFVPYIGRQTIQLLGIQQGAGPQHFVGSFDLRDFDVFYNPEWISVDLAGYNFLVSSQQEPGAITHECLSQDIPEPATLALACMALAGLGRYVRRRRYA